MAGDARSSMGSSGSSTASRWRSPRPPATRLASTGSGTSAIALAVERWWRSRLAGRAGENSRDLHLRRTRVSPAAGNLGRDRSPTSGLAIRAAPAAASEESFVAGRRSRCPLTRRLVGTGSETRTSTRVDQREARLTARGHRERRVRLSHHGADAPQSRGRWSVKPGRPRGALAVERARWSCEGRRARESRPERALR